MTSAENSSSASYEIVSLVKPEVFVYRIPPLSGNKGYKASDWNLGSPDWVGRLRLISVSNQLEVRLEDKTTGQLFARAPISGLNSIDFDAVSDSSRYFVLRLRNDNGQTAFVGIGFSDRSDSFDLNVAIQDHFKVLTKFEEKPEENAPKLDLCFKEGQTITVNIGKKSTTSSNAIKAQKPAAESFAFPPLLPPPPSSSNRVRK